MPPGPFWALATGLLPALTVWKEFCSAQRDPIPEMYRECSGEVTVGELFLSYFFFFFGEFISFAVVVGSVKVTDLKLEISETDVFNLGNFL